METYYCPHLFRELKIDSKKIEPYDCTLAIDFAKNNNIETFKSYDKYFDYFSECKKKTIKQFISGKLPIQCQMCGDIENIKLNFSDYIKAIFINKNVIDKIFIKPIDLSSNEKLDYMDIFKNMSEKNLFDKEKIFIDFHDSNITNWEEVKDIIEAAYKYNIKNYTYITDAENFISEITEYSQKTYSKMIIPFFAGCRETYQNINNSNKFDNVINNIVEYAKAKVEITFKYIILENVNDNLDELKKFCNTILEVIEKAKDNGGICAMIDIDNRYLLKSDYVMPDEHKKLIDYILEWGKFKDLNINMRDHVRKLYEAE